MRALVSMLAAAVVVVQVGFATGAAAQCALPLASHGPVDPAHGFPKYYIDSNGLPLAACLNFVCDPALPLPNPAAPVSFPGNFPVEFFYHRAIADAPPPLGGSFVAALEGSFSTGAVAAGDQMVFTRLRTRLTGLTPNGTYTIDHPWGTMVLAANGTGVINDTQDVGIVPIGLLPTAFDLALNGNVGPFVTFLSGPVPPLPGQIGTTAASQTVQGSLCGQNFLRVRGPGLPAAGVTQTLFSTLIGEKAAVCGNGVLDPGEQCDDHNILAGDCCAPDCTFEAAGLPCQDANACTANSTCDGLGTCLVTGAVVGPCDDGNACTLGDACAGTTCVPGALPTCPPPTTVEADAEVRSDATTSNFGTATSMRVDGNPLRQSLIRVRVSGVRAGSVTKALLRLTVTAREGAANSGGRIHLANCSWAENTVTWNTRPAFNALALDTKPAVNIGQQVDFDVTPVVTGDGLYCFTIESGNANFVTYASRQNLTVASRPQLIVSSSCCLPPPPPGPPRCGDNVVNQLTEQCDGTDAAVCPGLCLANCTCCATSTTCAAQGATCGTIPNGCGGSLTCGTCTAPQTCGGAGLANVCGCTPTTCAAQGKTCGTIPNGCGGTLTCGTCIAPNVCGGGGIANVCGVGACVPTTCAAQGKTCGTIPDGCGGSLACGTCTAPQTCGGGGVANVCGAPAPTTATLTVTATGRGGERITSTPAGINVATGSTGSAPFTTGTSITLSVTNGRDVIFSGACSSNGNKVKTCTFTLNANASVTANVQ